MDDVTKNAVGGGVGLMAFIKGIGWIVKEVRLSSRRAAEARAKDAEFREQLIAHMSTVNVKLESIADKVDKLESCHEKFEKKLDRQADNILRLGSQSHEFLFHVNQLRSVVKSQGLPLDDYSDYMARKNR